MAPRKRRNESPTISTTEFRRPGAIDWREISRYELVFEDRFAYKSRAQNCSCPPNTPPQRKEGSVRDESVGVETSTSRPRPGSPVSESPPQTLESPGASEAFIAQPESRSDVGQDRIPAVTSSTPLPGTPPSSWPEAGVSAVLRLRADTPQSPPDEEVPSGCRPDHHVTLFERSFVHHRPRAPGYNTATLVTILCLSSSTTPAKEPIDHLLSLCEQTSTTTFEEALRISEARECKKLGEGSYGEVYRIRHHGGLASAIKVVPIEGSVRYNGDDQMTVRDVLPEVVTSRELSNLRRGVENRCANFVELKNVHCIKDKYHPALLKAWDEYNDSKGSENDNPGTLPADQIYVALEYADGGRELEAYEVRSPEVACGIVLQVACALAVAERELRFEHRDLHESNILVAPFIDTHVEFVLEGQTIGVPSHGILVTLIDYTLSRMQKGNGVIYMDLAKGDLFSGRGHHQFDMYRAMREHTGNVWRRFVPSTNALWLHHLSSQLYRRKYAKGYRNDRKYHLLRKWSAALAREESATEFVKKCRAGRPSLFW